MIDRNGEAGERMGGLCIIQTNKLDSSGFEKHMYL